MRQGEYEQRRRALERQFREDVELLRAGYQAKLRALEMLWLVSPGEALPAGPPAPGARETLRLSETLVESETLVANETLVESETLPVPEMLPEPPAPGPARRRGQALEDVWERFAELPEVFDQRDVVRVLGYAVPRATLYRICGELLREKRVVLEEGSSGPNPTRYRKLPEPLGPHAVKKNG
jgi:hypothetical protein